MHVLPTEVRLAELAAAPRGTLRLGVGERGMDTVGINLIEGPHFLAVGAAGCGRSTVLKTAITAIKETFTPEEAFLLVFDVGINGSTPTTPTMVRPSEQPVHDRRGDRRTGQETAPASPSAGLSPDELARWRFTGERVFVIVDDLNLMTPAGSGRRNRCWRR